MFVRKSLLSEERPPFMVHWFDDCENYGLITSSVNTKEKIEEVSKTLSLYNNINDSTNEWWQVGLNFTGGQCVWSNGDPYVPEVHNQLFHEGFKPNCRLDKGFAYLKLSVKELFSFTSNEHVKKLCSLVAPSVEVEAPPVNIWIFFVIGFGLLVLLLYIVNALKKWFKKDERLLKLPSIVKPTKGKMKVSMVSLRRGGGTVVEIEKEDET